MLTNFVLFQAGWFACVLGAAHGVQFPGALAAALAVLVRLAAAPRRGAAAAQIALVTAIGAVGDGLLAFGGVLVFPPESTRIGMLPLFMVALWALFATTLDSSMRWSQTRPVLAACLGAVAGPLCYAAGERLGALELGDGWYWLAVEWALLMPLAAASTRRICAAGQP